MVLDLSVPAHKCRHTMGYNTQDLDIGEDIMIIKYESTKC